MSWALLVIGLGLGALLHRAYFRYMPGQPLQPYEQAVLRYGGEDGVISGPAWLKMIDKINLVGIYNVSEKHHAIHIEPAFARIANPVVGGLTRQRFYLDLVVVFRPTNMMQILRLGDDFPKWLDSTATAVVRREAFQQNWSEFDDGRHYAEMVRRRLVAEQAARGFEVVDVFVEKIHVRSPEEMAVLGQAGAAKTLGRDGIVLSYLHALEEVAKSPSTKVVIPLELSGDPDKIVRALSAEVK